MTDKSNKRRTQAERTKASDKAMFKAAITLIAQMGPKDMTLAMVGKESGFSRGLITYRFGSKSGLLIAVTQRIVELWYSRVLYRHECSGSSLLLNIAESYLDAVKQRSDLMCALFRLMQDSYCSCPELQPHFQEFDINVRGIISEHVSLGQQKGEFNLEIDPDRYALSYIALLRGIALQYFINPEAVDLEDARIIIKKMNKMSRAV